MPRLCSAALIVWIHASAAACPLCASDTAVEIRAELVDEHLPVSVVAMAGPLAVLGLALAAVAVAKPRARLPEDPGP